MILAFDIGGTRGRCGVAAGANLLDVDAMQRGADGGERWLMRLLESGKTLAQKHTGITAVGVSFGGPVSSDGRLLSMHVKGWEGVDLVGEIRKAFHVPVALENDANAGALGEHRFGAGKGAKFMAYFTCSTGIGGGVILDDKLYRGAHGMAAEFGHLVMHPGPNAPVYLSSKPGALEALASGPAVAREGKAALERINKFVPDTFTAKEVFDAARSGDAWAKETLASTTDHLARGVAAVMCAYDLERVVIGGGVSLAGDALFVPLREAVNRHLPHFLEGQLEVLPAALGDHSALMGAVAAAMDLK